MACIIHRVEDGTLRIEIPHLGITTYANNIEDANTAILEGVLAFHLYKYKYGGE